MKKNIQCKYMAGIFLWPLMGMLGACGSEGATDSLESLHIPGDTFADLSGSNQDAEFGFAGDDQPRTCKSSQCPFVSAVLQDEIFMNSPGSVLGQMHILDGWITADQERSRDRSLPCLNNHGAKMNLDLSFNAGVFPYTLTCLSKDLSIGAGPKNFVAYGLDYETGIYSIRGTFSDGGVFESIFVNEDDLGNAEIWQFDMLSPSQPSIVHMRLNRSKNNYELVSVGQSNRGEAFCGMQIKANKNIMYVEGKFNDGNASARICDSVEKQTFCFETKKWLEVDRSACLNSGLNDFTLQAINWSDINKEHLRTQLQISSELKKIAPFVVGEPIHQAEPAAIDQE